MSEPEDISVLMKRAADGSFAPLEMHRALRQTRDSFFGSSDVFLRVPGAASGVRYRNSEAIQFYLKVFISTTDPRASFFPIQDPTKFTLFKLQAREEHREVVLAESGALYTNREGGSPLLVRLFGDSSFQLSPTTRLAPGEYALGYDVEHCDNLIVYCFGVEP
ncbi:MAG: hypothetical protein KF760_16550 [Candidatus Eremiobacteraeota bacterium]|nr:hypothetical protein [Candidatus Eremiobacteraeota bacterium]